MSSAEAYKTTKLHEVVANPNERIFEFLLEAHSSDPSYINARDRIEGNTALHYAARTENVDFARRLIAAGADPRIKNNHGKSPLIESFDARDREMAALFLLNMYVREYEEWRRKLPSLLSLMEKVTDFEMWLKWDVRSKGIPFFSFFAPSDEFKIYKRGSNLRFDFTLVGYEKMRPVRGHKSFYFHGLDSGKPGEVTAVDHKKWLHSDALHHIKNPSYEELLEEADEMIESYHSSGQHEQGSTSAEISVENDAMAFVPIHDKRGLQKTDTISGWKCGRFELANLSVVVALTKMPKTLLITGGQSSAVKADEDEPLPSDISDQSQPESAIPPPLDFIPPTQCALVTPPPAAPQKQTFTKNIQGTFWLSNDFPLSVTDVLGLLDLLAPTNKRIKKMRDFLSKRMPPGFPVQCDIPVFSPLGIHATATFSKFQVGSPPAELFEIPSHYVTQDFEGSRSSASNGQEEATAVSESPSTFEPQIDAPE